MCAASEKENSAPAPTPQKKIRPFGVLRQFLARRGALKAEALRNYGLAAIIAYGMFDALTYSFSFLLSLRAYLAAGKELTWKTLPQVRTSPTKMRSGRVRPTNHIIEPLHL